MTNKTKNDNMKRLFRSSENKILGGLCAGVGDYIDADPTIIRLLTVLLTFLGGITVLVYLIGWIIVPEK